ncbi:hypothetical protein AAH991_38970 [Microbispora sp. ZYX-F-249]|uniref:Uncharacterized protein n=1 Tax=Microbispora maris TaxID=3144104 RepID=A0ABV0B0X1_9ACTN
MDDEQHQIPGGVSGDRSGCSHPAVVAVTSAFLSIVALFMTGLSYLFDVYDYDQVDQDTVAALQLLSVIGLLSAVGPLLMLRRHKVAVVGYSILILLAGYRLFVLAIGY